MTAVQSFRETAPEFDAVISAHESGTIYRLFYRRCGLTPDRVAYLEYDRVRQKWQPYRWCDMAALVSRWQSALKNESLEPGIRLALCLPNGVDWVAAELAALSLGLVVVPLYVGDTPASIAHLIEDSDADILVVGDEAQWREIAPHLPTSQSPRRVVVTTKSIESKDRQDRLVASGDWLRDASDLAEPSERDKPGDLATIIYTSGTTGPPKGVMMSHRNLLYGVDSVLERVPPRPDDVFISFMPLAHVFERTVGYYLPMAAGCCIGYARSLETLRDDLAAIRPTVFVAVPRVYERIFTAVNGKADRHWLSRWLLKATVSIGWQRFLASQGQGPAMRPIDRLAWRLLSFIVPRKIAIGFGGRVRIAVSGGAVMSPRVARFFASIGMPLIQGYGLTEAGAPVSGNAQENNVVESVGPPFAGNEIRIAENGEILVRAPGVMLGYWKAPERTRAAIDDDGWLHTGDLGELIEGRLYIRGRLKEIILTSTGENIPPATIETNLQLDPMIDQAMVIGEGRPYLAALLVLNPEKWSEWAVAQGLDPEAPDSLDKSSVLESILERAAARLHEFPHHYQIRRIRLLREAWTVDNGLLTTTVKLKRHAIEKRYADEVAVLYRGHELPLE